MSVSWMMLCVVACVATPTASRLHLVDMHPRRGPARHFLFRGNNPMTKGKSSFPRSELERMLREAAASECGTALPSVLRFVDLDLENPADPGYADEVAYWRNRTGSEGGLELWPTFGSVLEPKHTPLRESLVHSGKWAIAGHGDHLTERLLAVRAMLTNESAPPTILYVHCNAGCDRTGEFVGAYAMAHLGYNATTAMGEACRQCGRCPNYYATNSIGWFCLTLQYLHNRTDLGNCLDIAGCTFLGDCRAHSPTHPANPCPTDSTRGSSLATLERRET